MKTFSAARVNGKLYPNKINARPFGRTLARIYHFAIALSHFHTWHTNIHGKNQSKKMHTHSEYNHFACDFESQCRVKFHLHFDPFRSRLFIFDLVTYHRDANHIFKWNETKRNEKFVSFLVCKAFHRFNLPLVCIRSDQRSAIDYNLDNFT